ncbi:MAG: PQQ-dependent sugar dehydrogenase, partial [Dehalococcoidia bacterium]
MSKWLRWTALMALVVGMFGAAALTETPLQAQSRLLYSPWNLVTAAQGASVASLAAAIPQIESVHRWNADRESFENWNREAPSFLNTLTSVSAGDGLWVRVSGRASWQLPTARPTATEADAVGWRLIGWTDVDTPAAEVAAFLGVRRVIGFDSLGQEFRAFDLDLPSALNTLPEVRLGDAIWALFGGGAGMPGPVELVPALGGRVFDSPIELGAYPGGQLFVAELDGEVLLLRLDGSGERRLLDLRSRVSRAGGEEGLLSVALDPEFAENGYLYSYYSVAGDKRSRLSRFRVTNDSASLSSELVILEVAQPFRNHNGGAIRFGADGLLYLGLGDGGAGGDPAGNGQDRSTLLGSIIRIDVGNSSAGQPYAVPGDNPFLTTPGARAEIWAYGLRNPWRMAFDAATGALWVGDVGQDAVEEVDIVEAGGNYGWNRLEGDRCFSPPVGCSRAGTALPVATYRHSVGCSITGGVVYRGSAVAAIEGAYVYGDFCSGRIWALDAASQGRPVVIAESGGNIASFGV